MSKRLQKWLPGASGEAIWRYTRSVNTRRRFVFVGGTMAALLATGSASAQQQNPNQLPAQAAQAAGQAAQTAADLAAQIADGQLPGSRDKTGPKNAVDDARQGVVLIERKGKVLGVGSVLNGDGRILTALSPLSHGNNLDARFADGSVMRLKVGHTDRAWDLALLIPQNGRWKKGLKASKLEATKAGSALRAFTPVGKKDVAPARVIVSGLQTLQGGDSELLRDAISFGSRFKSLDLGTPIVDSKGHVVAMVAQACAPIPGQDTCKRIPYGVPTSAIKAFLRTVPAHAVAPAPWLGIQGVADEVGPVKGVRVLSVHPKSPAAAAGLAGSNDKSKADVVVAVNGAPVVSPEALSRVINQKSVGDSVSLLLFGNGKFRQVSLGLTAAPGTKVARKKKAAADPAVWKQAPPEKATRVRRGRRLPRR